MAVINLMLSPSGVPEGNCSRAGDHSQDGLSPVLRNNLG